MHWCWPLVCRLPVPPIHTSFNARVLYFDGRIALFRVLEMAEEFPFVNFRGLDLGACSSDA